MSSPLPPRRWILELTQACTLSCPSCNLGPDGGWNNEPEHPGQDWCTLLTAGVLRGLTHVSLLGGEPLLYPDLDQIIRHGQGKGLNMALVSNGLLLNPERVLNLQQHGLKGLVISLDHPDSRHDALRGAPGLFQHIDGLLSALVSHRRKGRLRLKRLSVNTLWHTTPERTELQAWMDWLRRRDVRRAHWFTPAALTPALRRETLQNCPDLAPGSHPFDHPQERAPVRAMSEDDWALVQTFCRRTGIHIEIEDQLIPFRFRPVWRCPFVGQALLWSPSGHPSLCPLLRPLHPPKQGFHLPDSMVLERAIKSLRVRLPLPLCQACCLQKHPKTQPDERAFHAPPRAPSPETDNPEPVGDPQDR